MIYLFETQQLILILIVVLTNKGLAYFFQEVVLATTSGSNLEHNKYVGQVSTIMRILTSKDAD